MGRLVVLLFLLFLLFGVYSQVFVGYTPDYYAESGANSQLEYTHYHPAKYIRTTGIKACPLSKNHYTGWTGISLMANSSA